MLPPIAVADPRLPVAGETLWTTADGQSLVVRFAVHAVRRLAGATVLDWSVTPLSSAGLSLGDPLPSWTELGLTRTDGGDVSIWLVAAERGEVYRPLAHQHRRLFNHCLCSPTWLAQQTLRLGETWLLQVAYPELPTAVTAVDVVLMNATPIWQVPVSAIGDVPTAFGPVNLARAPERRDPLAAPRMFAAGSSKPSRTLSITPLEVSAGPRLTAVRWRIQALSDGIPYVEPLTERPQSDLPRTATDAAAGLQLRPSTADEATPALRTVWVQFDADADADPNADADQRQECLCSTLGRWTRGLQEAGGQIEVMTLYPELPPGSDKVDLLLPGVGAIRALPVSRGIDAGSRLGSDTASVSELWAYDFEAPGKGWPPTIWPLPIPDPTQLVNYDATVAHFPTR